jgi:beta-mannanase
MGLAAIRPARVASLGMSASAALVISPDEVPAAAIIALGAWIPPVGPVWSHNHAANYQALVGKLPALVHWYQDIGNSPTWNKYSDVSLAGTTPFMITLELWDYTKGVTQPTYTNAAIVAGQHDAALTAFAHGAAIYGRPFLLRIQHEGTGIWYPWAAGPGNPQGNTPTTYIAAWRHVWQLFQNAGATNAKFVWCPSVIIPRGTASMVDMTTCYPGGQYVDYLSLDGYNWGSTSFTNGPWKSFGEVFQASYDVITGLGSQPLIIAETGSTEHGGDKAAWIANLAATAPTLFPRLKALIWFSNNSGADWKIDTSPASLAAFQSAAALPALSGTLTP